MSESTQSNSVGVQPATTASQSSGSQTSRSTGSQSSSSKSNGQSESKRGRGKAVYDNGPETAKSPNSKADARGPVTRVKDGEGKETKVYPGMMVGYSTGPGRENYDEGMYVSDGVNAFYERRDRDGVDLPD